MARPRILARPKRPSVLVLCEGSETEPNYLDALARERGWTGLIIPRNHRTDPLGLVKEAQQALKRDRDLSKAFVVIDQDEHPSYTDACHLAEILGNQDNRFHLIRTVPSFELWLVLHFGFTRAPMSRDEAYRRICALIPSYKKSDLSCMDQLISCLPAALTHAERSMMEALETAEWNSSTQMHLLIQELDKLGVN